MKVSIDVLVIATFLASIAPITLATSPVTKNQEVMRADCRHHENVDLTTREDPFGFDIDPHDNDRIEVFEDIHVERACVKGAVQLVPGEQAQKHDFEFLVKSKCSEQEMLDSLNIFVEPGLIFIKRQPHPSGDTRRVFLQVDVTIAVRPGLVQKIPCGTNITTRLLNTQILPGLSFETKRISLSSIYGAIICQEVEKFTAHNIAIYSKYGSIAGTWSLCESAAIETQYRNIEIDLTPKPSAGNISIVSKYGTINVRMPFDKEETLFPQRNSNLTTNNTSKSGIIHVSLLHGESTTIKLRDGTIVATLMPYWTGNNNTITTECTSCEMKFDLLNSVAAHPLHFTKSVHTVGNGTMHLSYPSEWAGEAEWLVKPGLARVRSEDYEVIERGFNHGKIQRCPLGRSHMEAEVKNGFMELEMKT